MHQFKTFYILFPNLRSYQNIRALDLVHTYAPLPVHLAPRHCGDWGAALPLAYSPAVIEDLIKDEFILIFLLFHKY